MSEPATHGEMMLLDERINHISNRLDQHISACTTRFMALLFAITVGTGIIALFIRGVL